MIGNFVETAWRGVMDEKVNPLKQLPLAVSHMIMLLLSWMWSAIFSLAFGSYIVFGISAAGHALVLAGIFTTIAVFKLFGRAREQRDAQQRLRHIWRNSSPI